MIGGHRYIVVEEIVTVARFRTEAGERNGRVAKARELSFLLIIITYAANRIAAPGKSDGFVLRDTRST